MSYDFNDPKTLTANESLILRAMLTHSYSNGYGKPEQVSRPSESTLRYTFEAGLRQGSLRHFVGYGNLDVVLEWTMMVASTLSEDRVTLPKQPRRCESWEDVQAEARRLFDGKFEADRQECQDELTDSPESFREWHRDTVVEDGQVTDPWGPALSVPVRWWLDNMTLVGVWLVYLAVNEAVASCVSENLAFWAKGDTDANPQQVASEAFSKGTFRLEKDIVALLAQDAPSTVAAAPA